MEQKDNLRMISEIHAMMEQSARFMSLSGLSGVVAGLSALMGAVAAWIYTGNTPLKKFDFSSAYLNGNPDPAFFRFFIITGLAVLIVAVAFGLFFSMRKAAREGKVFLSRGAKLMLLNISIPLLTGGVFILVMAYYHMVFLVPAVCLIFYGLALVNGSKYTLPDIRTLGLLEIALGLIACFLPGYGLLMWAIGFGVLHIIYGLVISRKYDRA